MQVIEQTKDDKKFQEQVKKQMAGVLSKAEFCKNMLGMKDRKNTKVVQ